MQLNGIEAQVYVRELQQQRNEAMDTAALHKARCQLLQQENATLKAQLEDANESDGAD